MKKLSLIMTSLIAISAGAQSTPPVDPTPIASTLAGTMKVMSSKLKLLTVQIADSSKNESSIQLASDYVAATLASKAFTPNTASSADRKAMYDKMLDDSAVLGNQIIEALKANDNATATKLLNDIVKAKKQGHTEFK